ncbi:MAG TPA: HEAT repeat domain-containing protein [Longimicrobiales bacterium]
MIKRFLISTMIVAITVIGASAPAAAQKNKTNKVRVYHLDGMTGLEGLKGLDGLKGLEGLEGLKGLAALDGLDALDAMDAYDAFDAYDAGHVRSRKLPRAPWQEQDPANGLYKAGRDELNNRNYAKAAANFAQIISRYPRSEYRADAYYWHAWSLYMIGSESELKTAKASLETQRKSYPRATTVTSGESATLLTRVNGLLARSGDAKSAEVVVRQTEQVVNAQCPTDENEEIRIEALNASLHMNSEQAIPLLKQVLAKKDACSAKLREKAVFLISQKRGSEVEDILLSTARSDPSSKVREQAVFWLSQVNTERALGMLEDILKTTDDDRIADKAIFAISQHRSSRASQMLRDYAANPSAEFKLRDKAIFWLGQRRGEENAQFLKDLYSRERDAKLKDKIIFALSQQRGNGGWLMNLATDENETVEMRKKALFWAGQNNGTAIAELTALYDRMRSREMKEQLIFVYSQRRDREAVDKLMDIAKRDTDRELRKKAIFWLGQSKDPRAAEFLMQLINQ